jgi:hypothetical protein
LRVIWLKAHSVRHSVPPCVHLLWLGESARYPNILESKLKSAPFVTVFAEVAKDIGTGDHRVGEDELVGDPGSFPFCGGRGAEEMVMVV